jgi:S1-C subfamily serine protease
VAGISAKMTKHLQSVLVVAFLVLSIVPLRADSIPEIVAKAKPAIVKIVAMDGTGSPIKFGTGFFVSPDGLVVTNFHVVDGAASLKAISTDGSIFLFQRLVAHPTGVDLAILQFQAAGVPRKSFIHPDHRAYFSWFQRLSRVGRRRQRNWGCNTD